MHSYSNACSNRAGLAGLDLTSFRFVAQIGFLLLLSVQCEVLSVCVGRIRKHNYGTLYQDIELAS